MTGVANWAERRLRYLWLGLACMLLSAGALAVQPVYSDSQGVAIRGYDPVAYFTEQQPRKGSASYQTEWQGAIWQFSSAQNLQAFMQAPARYAPQYGGYCAWAVSQGYTASINPNAWRIVDDKLYLNYSKGVQRKWQKDIPGNISRADANWPGLLAGK